MKRLLTALTLVAIFAAASFAAVQDFGDFTVDVPAGWTATKDGSTVGLVKDDNTASASITVDSTDGASAKELADAFVSELNGKLKPNVIIASIIHKGMVETPNGSSKILEGDRVVVVTTETGFSDISDILEWFKWTSR